MRTNLSFWHAKRILITGHTGFKGTWLSKILQSAGAIITGYALPPDSPQSLFCICQPDIKSVFADIRDSDALNAVIRRTEPEFVFHMAAQPLVLKSYREPGYTYEVNVLGTVNLLEAVRFGDSVRSVINVTTDKVYLNRERFEGYREDEQLNGFDPYSNSKSCSELVTSCYKNSFLNPDKIAVSTARSGNVIGGGDFSENRLIPDCVRAAANSECIKIRNPDSVRPYQHVLDTLSAYLLLAQRQYEQPCLADAYNIGPASDDCMTSANIADLFCQIWGDSSWEPVAADSVHEAALLRLNCARIKTVLGWSQHWSIAKAVEETIRWYKAYFSGDDTNTIMTQQIEEFFQ